MECIFITLNSEKEYEDLFWQGLGESAGIKADEMKYMDLKDVSPVSSDVWDILSGDGYVIIDMRSVNTSLAITLAIRCLMQPQRTYILLSSEQQSSLDWGSGAGVYEPVKEGKKNGNKLSRLRRDIAQWFETGEILCKADYEMPVRELLEKYWDKNYFSDEAYDRRKTGFEKISQQEQNTGVMITERLKIFMTENNAEGFEEELKKIENNKNIDPHDYILIGRLYKDMEFDLSRISILEQGNKIWKGKFPQLTFELIDAYTSSPNIEQREKALKMAENYFKIEYAADGRLVWDRINEVDVMEEDYLKSLFNAYISLRKYDSLYQITEYEGRIIQKTGKPRLHTLFLRNRAVCIREKGNYIEALKLFRRLYEQEATENTLNLIAITYESNYQCIEAASLYTVLVWLKYGDPDVIAHLAENMIKNFLVYDVEKGWKQTGRIIKETEKQVVPLILFLFSFEENQRKRGIIRDVMKVCEIVRDANIENFIMKGKDNLAYLWPSFCKNWGEEYDFSLVEYLKNGHEEIEKDKTKIEEYIKVVLPT